jgi:hypothetical protein
VIVKERIRERGGTGLYVCHAVGFWIFLEELMGMVWFDDV